MAREKASYEELQAFLAHVKAGRKLAAKKEDVAADRPAPVKSSSRRAAERRIRVMVVDDHEITRRFLFHLIQHMKDMEVVGLAPDGNTALAMAAEVRPDVAVVDFEMGEMNGPETTRRLRSELPQMQVVCLSMYDEETAAPIMKKAGAVAYVEKGTSSESLLSAIRDCAHPAAPPPKREGRAAKE